MNYIQLKNSDKLSQIGLGTMRLHDGKESVDTILKAIDRGINFINCGDFYNSELAVRETLVPKAEAKSLYQPVLTINKKGIFEKEF